MGDRGESHRHRASASGLALALGLVTVAVLVVGCGGSPSPRESRAEPEESIVTVPDTQPTRPMAFTSWEETFVDTSRPTAAGSQTPAAAGRTLVTTVYRPDGDGPFPLIMFSHGLSGHPDKFTQLLSAWAAAGYVVAAPAFPLTNSEVPGAGQNSGDLAQQPADVSFVLGKVLEQNEDPSSPLHGSIDPDHIGAGGLSLGGATTYAVAFGTCCRDDRVKAAEVFAGALLAAAGDVELDGHIPLLIVHGDADPALKYSLAVSAYDQAAPPVWFVTLLGASHATPFENDITPYDAMVEKLTTDFWDATIGRQPGEFSVFEADAAVDGMSTLAERPKP